MNAIKKIFIIFAALMLIFTMAVATASATSNVNEKKNNGIIIESKEKKVSSSKITWNANGGKIGTQKTKVTTIKKGSKIGKLVATPKRIGYSFKGWFTKKTGGKKISKNTKPTKSVTYYAQWTKKSKVLTTAEKKLVGAWGISPSLPIKDVKEWIEFKNDGTFKYYYSYNNIATTVTIDRYEVTIIGNYHVSNNKIYISNQFFTSVRKLDNSIIKKKLPDTYWLHKYTTSSYYEPYEGLNMGKTFDVNWLEINMYPNEKGVLNKYVPYTKPYKR